MNISPSVDIQKQHWRHTGTISGWYEHKWLCVLVMRDKEEKMKGMRSRVICFWWNMKHYSWLCSCVWGKQAHLLTHHTYSTLSVLQMRGLYCKYCTPSDSYLLNWFVALLTCICAEQRVDCLEEETSFIRRIRICYNITHKDITNIRRCRVYVFIAVQ